MAKEIILGIDLGTTNSVVSYMQPDGKVKIIPNPEGRVITPSVVAFKPNGEEIVGDAAKRQAVINSDTVLSVKRLMGSDQKIHIKATNKDYTPQEISAKILAYMKRYAEQSIGHPVTKAVITVPAYFNDAQRQATKDAGQIAGLEVMRIINEPTASSLAYGLESKKAGKILVYDLGGGTFDVSILEIGDGTFEVISTSGDNHLGGDDWDDIVAKWIQEQIRTAQGVTLSDKIALQRFKEAAEKAKIDLSGQLETIISLPFIGQGSAGPINYEGKLTRSKFQELTRHLVKRTEEPIRKALADAKLTANDIDDVLMIGGSIRMPAIQEMVQQVLGKKLNLSVNPDEAVSIGAAIQAGVLSGDIKDVVLLDVTPLTLGIETLGEVMTPLITRNTTIPTTKSQIFSTAADNQPAVDIMVYQGERPMARNNKLLGHFKLEGIKPGRRGEPRIEVTFSIDVNGIVKVSAKDLDSQKEQQITISGSTGLSKEEIDRMVREADENKEADEKRRGDVELKNKAEQYLSSIEQALQEKGDTLDAKQKEETTKLRDEIKEALHKDDYETLRRKIDELEKAAELMAQMQAGQQAKSEPHNEGANGTAKENDDDVIDADFTEKKK